ncbi:MAG: GAF domain-containing protein [Deltaproteobacteria bacterium]|nr:GAF domain-containing protein [Deltaproteobacteria bacterium]
MTDALHDGHEPAFGEADLSNCEREQIHLAGSIQPHGALLVVREPELLVVQASANAQAFLGLVAAPLGARLEQLCPDLAARIRAHLGDALDVLPVAVRCRVGDPPTEFDGLLHRPPAGGLIIELERAGAAVELAGAFEQALQRIVASASVRVLCDETARIFRGITGYDRVMVYRFDDEGHGEVLSEQKEPKLDPLLGNRYPASDIPQIARRLYERNRVRVLVDVEYEPVPILPRLSPLTGGELDMSLCFTRSMSPIHIQYLKNMGVCATLVVSLLVGERLWGLVACHHYQPRIFQYELRGVCELLAEVVGTRIAALESFAQSQAELTVRRLEHRMVETISRDGDWRSALFDSAQSILEPVGASGAALLLEDQVMTTGEVPSTDQLREIGRWLDRKGLGESGGPGLFATAALALDEPAFAPLTGVASGLVAATVSNQAGEYLVWFRPEQVRTVTWGGNPFKPVMIGNSPSDLSPRRSFAKWHQLVEGTSEPWSPASLTTARLIGDTVTDVLVQFRSVSMLIAQHQLDLVRGQVQSSDQAVIVADADTRLLMTSQAFEALLPAGAVQLERLEDLPRLFHSPMKVLRRLHELVSRAQTWRGEAELITQDGGARPVLVRADPVFSAPRKVLGFVVVLSDMSERKAADAARRRLQERIVETHRFSAGRLSSRADLIYQRLLSSVVENAQLAALEITDGVEVSRMAELVDSVRSSVERSAQLLELLLQHSASLDRD